MREYLDLAMPLDGAKHMQRVHEEGMLLVPILRTIEQLFDHHLGNEPRWRGTLDGFSDEQVKSPGGTSMEIAGWLYLLGDHTVRWREPASAFVGLSTDRERVVEYDLACGDETYGRRLSNRQSAGKRIVSPSIWAFTFRWIDGSSRGNN